jgi:serine/threonine protein phosphatase PrpC
VRDLLGKLFLGKNGSDNSKSLEADLSKAGSDEAESQPEAATEGEEEQSIEQTIEMTPVESVPQPASDSSGGTAGAEYSWADQDKANTKPLSPPTQNTLMNVASVRDARSTIEPPALQAAHLSHVGKHRTRNEDSTFIFTADSGGEKPLLPFGLYVVADGMGGHHAGHEASRSVAWLVASTVLERIYVPMLESSLSTGNGPQEPVMEVMVDAVQTANQKIHNPEPEKDSGTTLTAGLLIGQRLFIAHVGDSRAYLLEHGELTLLTTDHSYVKRLLDAGQLTEEEAAVHPQRNMLYKAVGQGGLLEIDTFTRSLPDKGMLMLCSDGLWGLVDDHQLQEVLTSSESLNAMSEELVNMALEAGGHDNISAVLVEFSF